MGFFRALTGTRDRLGEALRKLGRGRPDDDTASELTDALILADVGPIVAAELVNRLRELSPQAA